MVTVDPFSQAYRCLENAPLSCKQPCETSRQVVGAKFCLACGFPATLPEHAEIRGRRGTYHILNFVRTQGMGRLYKGIQLGSGQPVVVKEYLLPKRCFNPTEVQQRQNKFIQIAGASPIEPQGREFRFVTPSEAIADEHRECCYLITPGEIAAAPTLDQVLNHLGAMSNRQVRKLLDQVLQTLQFLHTQKFRLLSGHVQSGLVHGNLTLESLVMSQNTYVFICNLGSWERLFDPNQAVFPASDVVDDLVALGHIAFELWTGQTSNPVSVHSLEAKDLSNCPQNDPLLKAFLYRLLGLDVKFASAGDARQALLQLSSPDQGAVDTQEQSDGALSTPNSRKWRYWLLSLLILPLLGAVLWCIWPKEHSIPPNEVDSNDFNHLLPTFKDVNGLKPGTYGYTSERIGPWETVLDKRPVDERSMRKILTRPRTDVAAVFEYRKYKTQLSLLDAVVEDNPRTQFAVMDLVEQLPPVMEKQVVGYDGLLVYVTAYKKYNFPRALNGQISKEQLRQIFTGQITDWHNINPNLPSLPIIPYAPTDPEALRLFEQKVLNNDKQLIAQFQKVKQKATIDTLRAIDQAKNQDKSSEPGLIGFGILTRTWDQCKVYPLALSNGEGKAVQALQRKTTNGDLKPITPEDNRCNDEKQPFPDVSAFQSGSYLLSVPLIVAYPKDNSQPGYQSGPIFAELLKTEYGQYLLQQAGLVPLQPIPMDYQPAAAFANH